MKGVGLTLNKNYYYLIIVTLSTLAFFGFCIFLIVRANNATKVLIGNIETAKTEKIKLQELDDLNEQLKNKATILASYNRVLDEALPSEMELPEKIIYLRSLVSSVPGVDYVGVGWNIQEKKNVGGTIAVPIGFAFDGLYHAAIELVKNIESSRWLISLNAIDFRDAELGKKRVSVSGYIYLRNDPLLEEKKNE